jgi:hypothetical protein
MIKLKQKNIDRIDLTLDYLIDMTFDSHNYENWNDVPIKYRATIATLRKIIGKIKNSERERPL